LLPFLYFCVALYKQSIIQFIPKKEFFMSHFKNVFRSIKHCSIFAALFSLTLAIIAGTPTQLQAEYPTRPITLIVGFSAGGSTDMYARAFSSFAHEHLGMPVVVVNKPGATGMIAARAVYNARPDGYTLLFHSGGGFLIKSTIDGDRAPVKPMRDLKVLGSIGKAVTALVVPKDSPFKSAMDLVNYAKANPDKKMRWSHPGRGSTKNLEGMLFLKQNGIIAQDVPFKGGSKARNAVSAKQVDFSFIAVQLMSGFESKLHPLGVLSYERDLIFKDIPTLGEQGLPASAVTNPMIIWGHKDLPRDIVVKLEKAINGVASSKDFKKMTQKMGVSGAYSSPREAIDKIGVIDKLMTPFIKEMFHKK
jgi:tripartite-type tricarboxylate transporter receptor subunit TctC